MLALYHARTPFFNDFFSYGTHIGGGPAVILITLLAGTYLLRTRSIAVLTGFFVAICGSIATTEILKLLVQRTRPGAPFPLIAETSYSFPSAHATAAVALYGFLAYIILRRTSSRLASICIGTGTALIILFIGLSRLYLGVHYATDVIGGFIIGGLFLAAGIYITQRRARKTPLSRA